MANTLKIADIEVEKYPHLQLEIEDSWNTISLNRLSDYIYGIRTGIEVTGHTSSDLIFLDNIVHNLRIMEIMDSNSVDLNRKI